MAYAHVAHNCALGDHVIVANAVQFAGYVSVGSGPSWAGCRGAPVHAHRLPRHGGWRLARRAGRGALHQGGGEPAAAGGLNRIGLERRGVAAGTVAALDECYRLLFRRNLTVARAVAGMRAAFPGLAEVEHLARFAETSTRGLTADHGHPDRGLGCGGVGREARPRVPRAARGGAGGVYDRDQARAREVAARHACRAFATPEAMLAACEAVSVAVPTVVHREAVEQAAAAGATCWSRSPWPSRSPRRTP